MQLINLFQKAIFINAGVVRKTLMRHVEIDSEYSLLKR